MRTETEIREAIDLEKMRQSFFENNFDGKITTQIMIDEAANKIMALSWVLEEIDDLYEMPPTNSSLIFDLQARQVLDEINKKLNGDKQ